MSQAVATLRGQLKTRDEVECIDLCSDDDSCSAQPETLTALHTKSQQQHALGPPNAFVAKEQHSFEAVSALLSVLSVDDILPALEEIAAAGDLQKLRDLYRAAARVQDAVRKVQAQHQMHYWLPLRCHCNSWVHWALGDTKCKGDRSRRGYQHKLHIERLLCSFCNTTWQLAVLDARAARSQGSWHPRLNKHCINPECSRAEGKEAYKTATCSDVSKKNGPVLLR